MTFLYFKFPRYSVPLLKGELWDSLLLLIPVVPEPSAYPRTDVLRGERSRGCVKMEVE